MNATGDNTQDQPGSGGPVVAIVLGAVIIIGAVVLVWNVGNQEATASAPKGDDGATAAAANEPAGEESAENSETGETEEAEAGAKDTQTVAAENGATPDAEVLAKIREHMAKEEAVKTGDENLDRIKAYADIKLKPGGPQIPVQVELPNPAFAGTPKEAPKGVKMKKLTGKDRGPYILPRALVESLTNLAAEKEVTSSDDLPLIGDLEQVTDGDKEPLDGRWVELMPGKQWVQVDLGKEYENFAIFIWHNHMETALVYKDVVVQVSNDPDFVEGVKTVFNNDWDNSSGFGVGADYEYFENYEGLLVPLYDPATQKGMKFRYVRAYSNGSTTTQANHYTELEVHGREIK